jgi:hypothetical protein
MAMRNELVQLTEKISKKYKADVFLFSADITVATEREICKLVRDIQSKRDNAYVLLCTNGGDP